MSGESILVARATKTGGRPSSPQTTAFKHLVLAVAGFLVLLPGYFMIITATKTQEDYAANKFGFPQVITADNFSTALRGGRFFVWFGNSLILCIGAVTLSTVV